ncbi:hypothetical protein HDU97_006761, partial [Phlyctochytrium planicorne]
MTSNLISGDLPTPLHPLSSIIDLTQNCQPTATSSNNPHCPTATPSPPPSKLVLQPRDDPTSTSSSTPTPSPNSDSQDLVVGTVVIIVLVIALMAAAGGITAYCMIRRKRRKLSDVNGLQQQQQQQQHQHHGLMHQQPRHLVANQTVANGVSVILPTLQPQQQPQPHMQPLQPLQALPTLEPQRIVQPHLPQHNPTMPPTAITDAIKKPKPQTNAAIFMTSVHLPNPTQPPPPSVTHKPPPQAAEGTLFGAYTPTQTSQDTTAHPILWKQKLQEHTYTPPPVRLETKTDSYTDDSEAILQSGGLTLPPLTAPSKQPQPPNPDTAMEWTSDQVGTWLESIDVTSRIVRTFKENGITGYQLFLLSENRLMDIGIANGVTRQMILTAVDGLRGGVGGGVGGGGDGDGIGGGGGGGMG